MTQESCNTCDDVDSGEFECICVEEDVGGTHIGKLSKVRSKGPLAHGNAIKVLFRSKSKQLAILGVTAVKNTVFQVRMDAIKAPFLPEAICDLVSNLAQSDMKQGILKQMK